MSNQNWGKETITRGLELLRQGLFPFIQEAMQAEYGDDWAKNSLQSLPKQRTAQPILKNYSPLKIISEDVANLLTILDKNYTKVFKDRLSKSDKVLVNELQEIRNQWAHESEFPAVDVYRSLDSIRRLLQVIGSSLLEEVVTQQNEALLALSHQNQAQQWGRNPNNQADRQFQEQCDRLISQIPFQNLSLLKQALTHRSYKNEHPSSGDDNERLEFLGDSVLGLVVAEYIHNKYPYLTEGELTQTKSRIVENTQLEFFANQLNLGDCLRLGNSLKRDQKLGQKNSVLANAFEALIGAYYLDSGLAAVQAFFWPKLDQVIEKLGYEGATARHPKSALQEFLQQPGNSAIFGSVDDLVYSRSPQGPPWIVRVQIDGFPYGQGTGDTIKAAEAQAAIATLAMLKAEGFEVDRP
ncbi:MAG: ribonuclease III [Limnothrix sp. CACIAM 69d]|nr:MAG: ribonuclease III [Limnothrix sp. CACIAM 69d]